MSVPVPALLISEMVFAYPGQAPVLSVPHFEVASGEKILVRGKSGAGKSTLLNLIAGTLSPRDGVVCVLGKELSTMSDAARDSWRADNVGIVFQLFNLIPYLSILDNVLLPCRFSTRRRELASAGQSPKATAIGLLERLGLDDPKLLSRPVTSLSVGQQQRVAAARALIGRPGLVIADEPTSALDPEARDAFLALVAEEAQRSNAALLVVSHDPQLGDAFDRIVDLSDINHQPGESA